MRPPSILNFERLYLGALILGIINLGLTWNETMATIESQPNAPAAGSSLMYIAVAFGIVIPLLLWYFVARRASVVAKWILVVLFVLGLIGAVVSLGQGTYPKGIGGIVSVVATLMQAAAIYFLFRPDAKAWFSDGRGGADPEVFR